MCDDGHKDYLLDEYKEIGINWRYWGDVRWKLLTAFLTLSSVIGAAVFTAPRVTDPVRSVLGLAGIALAALFWVLEERATYYRRAYLHRTLEIEQEWFRAAQQWDPLAREAATPRQYHVTHNPYWTNARSEHVFRFFYALVAWLWAFHIAALAIHAGLWFVVPLSIVSTFTLTVVGWLLGAKLQSNAGSLNERGLTIPRVPRSGGVQGAKEESSAQSVPSRAPPPVSDPAHEPRGRVLPEAGGESDPEDQQHSPPNKAQQ